MEWMFIGIVVFLFLLAAFDLYVGVSNDAVNFQMCIRDKEKTCSRLGGLASSCHVAKGRNQSKSVFWAPSVLAPSLAALAPPRRPLKVARAPLSIGPPLWLPHHHRQR